MTLTHADEEAFLGDGPPDITMEYEQALLGALLCGTADIPALSRMVSGSDFYRPAHEDIWNACLALHAAGTEVNPLTVMDHLGSKIHTVGGGPYLHTLYAQLPTDPAWSAFKVRESKIRRDVADIGKRCQQVLQVPDHTPEDLVAYVRGWADSIGTNHADTSTDIGQALEQVIDAAEHGEARGIQMPWRSLDDLIDGVHPGQVVTFAASSGAGKSLALENFATHVARSEAGWVLMVSLEMSPKEITQRTLAHTARVKLSNIRRGQEALSEPEWQAIAVASEKIRTTKLRFDDKPSHTVSTIRAAVWDATQYAKRHGEELVLVVVDYIQLVTPPPESKGMTRQQRLGEVSRQLKQLARETQVPLVTASQLNKHDGIPTLDNVRESADIVNDSDIVILMHEQTVEDGGMLVKTGDLDLIVAKNRNGPEGKRTVQKYGAYARLYDMGAH